MSKKPTPAQQGIGLGKGGIAPAARQFTTKQQRLMQMLTELNILEAIRNRQYPQKVGGYESVAAELNIEAG